MNKIDIFPWNENFNTEIKTVDEQHQKLVEIINHLATQFSFNPESIDLSTVFDELLAYTHYHFETEEAIWESYLDDTCIHTHQDTHQTFIDEVKTLIEKQKGNSIEVTSENTLNFLVKWLVSHILESDRYMAYRVIAIENGYSLDESIAIAKEKMSGHTREMIDIIIRIYDSLSHTTLQLMRELNKEHEIQQTLSSKEQLLATVINEMPDVFVLKDHKGNFLLGNKVVADLYNTTPEEMIGKHDGDFGVPKKIADSFRKNVLSIMKKGETEIVYEDSRDARSGEIRHYKSIKKPFKDMNGNNQILVIAQDITEQQNKEERLNYAMQGSSDGLWDWNIDKNKMYFSPRWFEMLGYKQDELPSSMNTWKKLMHPDDLNASREVLKNYIKHKMNQLELEYRMRHKDGHWVHILSRAQFVKEKDGTLRIPYRLVGTHVDITERWEHQQELIHLAHYDNLTNLPNRLLFSDRLEQALLQSTRHKSQVAVLYLDLDGFKVINDTYGHDVGDTLLLEIAKRLDETLRMEDTLSRFGGDEFVAVIQDFNGKVPILHLLERLLETSSTPIIIGDLTLQVSISIGVTFYPQADNLAANQLIRQADQAMYRAKQLGRNRYHIFDSNQDRMIRDEHASMTEIRSALENNQFVLYYQPKVNMCTGEIIGVEALIRWKHPQKGLLVPIDFLPKIENHPLIVDLGDWVFEQVMLQIDDWQKGGIDLSVSVNISAKQLGTSDFIDKLASLLKRYPNIQPNKLELEILETSALEKITYVVDVMEKCQELGVNFALDDFGTGYSSLTYLKRLPVDLIKIDKSFILNLLDDSEDLAIVEGILELASTFKRNIIAEGVESVEHGMILLLLGCTLAQGYAIAKPMPINTFHTWMKDWKPPVEWLESCKLSNEDESLLYAIVEHRKWIKYVIGYVQGKEVVKPEMNIEKCMFGQWLQHSGHYHPRYKEINVLHKDIHSTANELIQAKESGNSTFVKTEIKNLEELGDNFIRTLFSLISV